MILFLCADTYKKPFKLTSVMMRRTIGSLSCFSGLVFCSYVHPGCSRLNAVVKWCLTLIWRCICPPPLHRINISEHARHYCHLCESMGWGMSVTVPYPLRSSPLPFDGNNKANQESGELFTGLSGANWDVKSRSRNPGAWNAGNIREGEEWNWLEH